MLLGVDTVSWGNLNPRVRARLRLAVFERDGWVCRLRYPGICTHTAEVADHVRDRELYGDGLDNLQAACAACNGHKGKPGRSVDPPHVPPRGAWW